MKTGNIASVGMLSAVLSGCTVSHDRNGNPNGVGFFVAASEQPTDPQRAGEFIQETAADVSPWLPAPWGELLTLGAGAVGVGVLGARQRKREDTLFDEGVRRGNAGEVAPA
ncbi:MAG: hypothetical protein AAGB51_12425 [Planctomycetota bacterium]